MPDFFDPVILPFIIFLLRVLNNAVGTLRIIAMHSMGKVVGFLLASLKSLMFAYTAGIVLTDLNNVPNLVAYVLGFSVGGYVGMFIEQRYLDVYNVVEIIAEESTAHDIAQCLRDEGHGVTELHGEGARGHVLQLRTVVHHTDVKGIIKSARGIKPNVFITVEESLHTRRLGAQPQAPRTMRQNGVGGACQNRAWCDTLAQK